MNRPTVRICQLIFSTNRPEYLVRTLRAQRHLDFSGCSVETKILIDDFPKGRNDQDITRLAEEFGYRVILHDKNESIGVTWKEAWSLIREQAFDYIWHQEDDAEILEDVPVLGLVDALESSPKISQVVLKRQPWYGHETESVALDSDTLFPAFRGEFSAAQVYFTPIASLYSRETARFDYNGWYRKNYPDEPIFHTANLNEAIIGKALLEEFSKVSMHLKNRAGRNIISHIGEYTVGQKLLPHEPGYASFADINPELKYSSKVKKLWDYKG